MPPEPVIDALLVARLVAGQFPGWAGLPVMPVDVDGWDNRTFRLGTELSVRLPSAARYTAQLAKEHRWLPALAPQLPLPIPVPLAVGQPAEGYPWRWSVYGWIEGTIAGVGSIGDPVAFATALAGFLSALQRIDPAGGPPPGPHNFHRGGPLETYDAETRGAIAALGDAVPAREVTAVWEAALATSWRRPPVWVHGDVSAANLLVRGGSLAAVIDFGGCAVGDPACDLVIAWTLLSGAGREAFRSALALDPGTWARGRGWALWKALITLNGGFDPSPTVARQVRHVLDAVLADHRIASEQD